MLRKFTQLLMALAFLLPLAGGIANTQAQSSTEIIRVGSKSFTEAEVLSWIVFLVLEDEGLRVVEDMETAPTTGEVRQALLDGEIDVYVEYTATGVLLLSADNPEIDPEAAFDANTAFSTVSIFDNTTNDLTWLQPAPANNTYALAVTEDFAEENNLETLEDLSLFINAGNDVTVAGNTEFFERKDAFPSFGSTYGWEADAITELDLGEDTQPPDALAALESGENGTNVAMAYGTTGTLLVGDFTLLEDPEGAQPVYAPAPVFRGEIIRDNPNIAVRLQRVFQELDNRTLQNLNVAVDRFGDSPREAAANFLIEIGEIGDVGDLCEVTSTSTEPIALRAGPDFESERRSTMPPGGTLSADGQFVADDGTVWYRLVLGPWVNEELVAVEAECELAEVDPNQ